MPEMKLTIDRLVMSGKGPRVLYAIKNEAGQTLFKSNYGAHLAWTKKKDAQGIINAIETHGLEYVEAKLERKAFLN